MYNATYYLHQDVETCICIYYTPQSPSSFFKEKSSKQLLLFVDIDKLTLKLL